MPRRSRSDQTHFLHRQKRWDRTIKCVGDGAQKLRLVFLDDPVGGDGFGAGTQDRFLDLRRTLVQAIEGRIDFIQVIIRRVQLKFMGRIIELFRA